MSRIKYMTSRTPVEVAAEVEAYAKERGLSVSKAMVELMSRSLLDWRINRGTDSQSDEPAQ